jgi:predicted DNA-binding antitoxin AbrB/MazE fold protein
MDTVQAIYEKGQLRLLSPVHWNEGQVVQITIESSATQERLRLALNDNIFLGYQGTH